MILFITNKPNENQYITEHISNTENEIVETVEINDIKNISNISNKANNYKQTIIDITGFNNDESETVDIIHSYFMMYTGSLIILAVGLAKTEIIDKLYRVNIFNFITAVDKVDILNQLHDSLLGCTKEKAIIHTNHVHQNGGNIINKQIKIGIISSSSRCGATTISINLLKHLTDKNLSSALIEKNPNNHLYILSNVLSEAIIDKSNGKIAYNNMNIFYNKEIREDNIFNSYKYLLYDYGCYNHNNLDDFLFCDIKIVISGSKAWELDSFTTLLNKTYDDNDVSYIFNFTDKNDVNTVDLIKCILDYRANKAFFIGFIEDYLNIVNKNNCEIYNNILGIGEDIVVTDKSEVKVKNKKFFGLL